MTLIEKVARALAAHSWELGGNDHSKEPFVNRRWPHYVGQARAAIEAMREPTNKMVDEEGGEYINLGRADDASYQPRLIWQGMVDTALSERVW